MTSQTMRILEAMLEDPAGDWYGLQLSEAAGLKSGTIYPALARLVHYGWLEARWESIDPSEAGRPKRKLYRLTREGAATARVLVAERSIEAAGRSAPRRGFNPYPKRRTT
jgi:DNA-binding PadR family transcriptional regulator